MLVRSDVENSSRTGPILVGRWGLGLIELWLHEATRAIVTPLIGLTSDQASTLREMPADAFGGCMQTLIYISMTPWLLKHG